MDEEGTCVSVNVYNLAQGAGMKIGDRVAIPEPQVKKVKIMHKGSVSYGLYYILVLVHRFLLSSQDLFIILCWSRV